MGDDCPLVVDSDLFSSFRSLLLQNYRIAMKMQGAIFQFEEAPSCPLYLAPPHSNLWYTKKAEIHNTNLV